MVRRPRLFLLLLAALCCWAGPLHAADAASSPAVGERFHYRWHLTRLGGFLAGLFFPDEGDGVLTVEPTREGVLASELLITSEQSRANDYFRYGSEVDTRTGRTLRAWSSYQWRGETKNKSGEVAREQVVDIASGIYLLRRNPPKEPVEMEIWSDGKIYPVRVVPRGFEFQHHAGASQATRHLAIEGIHRGSERFWKGSLDLWLALDDRATPVQITISRRGAGVQLELVP